MKFQVGDVVKFNDDCGNLAGEIVTVEKILPGLYILKRHHYMFPHGIKGSPEQQFANVLYLSAPESRLQGIDEELQEII